MTEPITMFTGAAAFTLTALVASFGAWFLAVRAHLADLSDRGQFALKFVVPTFLAITTGAVLYVTVAFAGRAFPAAGLGTMTAGIVGSFLAAGYVLFELRSPTGPAPTTRAEFDETDAAT